MIATSIVQSLRLLDAGMPVESADMHWFGVNDVALELVVGEPFLFLGQDVEYPAWSLSALWQMIHEYGEVYEFSTDTGPDELIESLVTIICSHYAPAPSEQ